MKRPFFLLAGGVLFVALPLLGALAWFSAPVQEPPPFSDVKMAWRPSEAWLLDRNGEVLHELRVDASVRRLEWVPLEEVSPALTRALLWSEDRRFDNHKGVDWLALLSAAADYLTGEAKRGASTVSMQVAGMLDRPDPDAGSRRTLDRKLRQIRAALALEGVWTKGQILEAYLNLASFRGELQGIAAASEGLLGKSPSGLDETESFLLAALLPSPGAAPSRVARRACEVARAFVPHTECDRFERLAAESLGHPPHVRPAVAVASQLAHRLLRTPGARVPTTLDLGIQRLAVRLLSEQLRSLGDSNVRDGAALVVDNESGDILAYVASAGPASTAAQVDGVRARRQAGSTLKPFIYGLALERGYLTAASLLEDAPLQVPTGRGLYAPQNYDQDFKGLVSLRTALASSLNIPAIRALMMVGLEPVRDRLRDQGYAGIDEPGEYYGYSLALGSPEVSLLEQVTAYRSLANGGRVAPLRLTPDEPVGRFHRVLDERAAFILSDILADRAGRAVTFGLANPLATRHWSAVKTGTSKDMRDNWCIGFSDRYTVGVWVGNFEGDSMHRVSGISGAAPAWLAIMEALHGEGGSKPPRSPPGLVNGEVRFEPDIEPPREEWFVEGTESAVVRALNPGIRPPSLQSPTDGAVIALDPDVPPANQKVVLGARPASGEWRFVMDGVPLPQDAKGLWQPVPGVHVLELRDGSGSVHDALTFEVRTPHR